MLLTDNLLLDHKRCSRRSYLDMHGDPSRRDPVRPFLVKLRRENQGQIEAILARSPHVRVQASPNDPDLALEQTYAFMEQGVERIANGVLVAELDEWNLPEPLILMASPTLLVKQPGKSAFGDWCYSVVNIKLGRRAKPEYKLIAAFQAWLLEAIQSAPSPTASLILRNESDYQVNLPIWRSRMFEVLDECLQMLLEREEPEVFISRQRCNLCHWQSDCLQIARQSQHLSLLPGITPSRYASLQALQLHRVEDITRTSPLVLEDALGRDVAAAIAQQAQSVHLDRPLLKPISPTTLLQTLPTSDLEIYFDIEAEPERNLDYLLGVLLVDRRRHREQFYPFVAETPEQEATIWEQFLAFVSAYPQAPIFHFSEYETEAIARLAKRYQTPQARVHQLLGRFFDIHRCVVSSVTLPVESYSLKSLAQWLGFQWRDAEASGEQSVCWYDLWLQTGDRAHLDAILVYNEDDCRATRQVKDWLVDFLLLSQLQAPTASPVEQIG